MVKNTRLAFQQPTRPEDVVLAKMNLECRKRDMFGNPVVSDFTVQVYRACMGKSDRLLYLLDIVTPTVQSLQAVRASLTKGVPARYRFEDCPAIPNYINPEKETQYGYRTYTETLGDQRCPLYHLIAVANKPGFMPYVTPHALAKCLATDAYSTPFLTPTLHGESVPDWMPYIRDKLLEGRTLQYENSFNCLGGTLLPGSEKEVENIISEGVRSGALLWPEYDVNEIVEAQRDAGMLA